MNFLIFIFLINKINCLSDKVGREEFRKFKSMFKKVYSNQEEENKRYKIFSNNYDKIALKNAEYVLEKSKYQLAINFYSDMEMNEFLNLRSGLLKASSPVVEKPLILFKKPKKGLLQLLQFDWRSRGRVTAVKDQGSCGSCWAFSAVGAIESAYAIKTGRLLNFSEQNLIDCTNRNEYGNRGCNGGLMSLAYLYVIANPGINIQSSYPYEAINTTCRFRSNLFNAKLITYAALPVGDEQALEYSLLSVGPISAGIGISQEFVSYFSGILTSDSCSTTINHAVLVVGFNNTNQPPFWIVKNSWGTWWGERGYIRIEKGKNACGIANLASYPIL